MRIALMTLILLGAGCAFDDGTTAWSVTIGSSPSANPVSTGQEIGFVGTSSATGTSLPVVTSSWSEQSAPGSYVLNGTGTSAIGAFSSPGTDVVLYAVTYTADDGSQHTSSSVIALSVLLAPHG